MNLAFSTAVGGVHAHADLFARRAEETLAAANARPDPNAAREAGAAGAARRSDIVTGVTGLAQAETGLKASVAVARGADQLTGALLDILA